MTDLAFDHDAADALTRLENDSSLDAPLNRVNAVPDALASNSGQAFLRRHRFTNGLWCVVVAGADEDWAILWEPHPHESDTVVIQYLGPASFT